MIKDNYDDVSGELYNKVFPQVSKNGTSYLFLWFSPFHGHGYGFHLIPGSEGRRDITASLHTHLNEAPKELFYGFSCSLSQYNHNRESSFFQYTRYFRDVFHGFRHKCTKAFCSNWLIGPNCLNTNICVQFNSFIQNIKASAKLLNQCHFTFYLQFFIYQCNKQKQSNFGMRCRIARASHL